MTTKHVYTDKYGNELYSNYIQTSGMYQWSAKNKEGQSIPEGGVNQIVKLAIRDRATEFSQSGKPDQAAALRNLERKIMAGI